MASSAESIKNFFVSLGWKIDTAGMNRFASSIAVQTEAVRELGEALKASAEKVVGFVRSIIDTNDNLYFTSQRLQSAASNIKALQYAAGQTGGENFATVLLGQVQTLKESLETMPGMESLINQRLGLATRDVNGKLRDRVEIFRDITRALNQMQGPLKYATASQLFHIDPTTLDLLSSDKFQKFFDEYIAKSGRAADQASIDANRIETAHRRLTASVEILKDRIEIGLMTAWDKLDPKTKETIKSFFDLEKQLGRLIYWWEHLSEGQKTAIKWIAGTVAVLAALAAGLGALGTAIAIITPAVEVIGALIAALFSPVTLVIGGVAALATGVYLLYKHFDLIKEETKAVADIFLNTLKPVLADVRDLLKDIFTGHWGDAKKKAADIAELTKKGVQEAGSAITQTYRRVEESAQPQTPGDKSQPRGIQNNNPGNINYGEFAREHGANRGRICRTIRHIRDTASRIGCRCRIASFVCAARD